MDDTTDTTQPEKSPRQFPVKQAITALVALVIVAGTAVGTVMILRPNLTKKSDNLTNTTPVVKSAADIYSAATTMNAIAGLSEDVYSKSETGTAYIMYKSSEKAYAINAPSVKAGYFNAKEGKAIDDRKTVTEQFGAVMSANGLTQAEAPVANTETTSYAIYQNNAVACQLTSSYIKRDTFLSGNHIIACTDKQAADTAYKTAEDMIALSDAASDKIAPKLVTLATGGKDAVTYTMLMAQGDKQSTLLFAAVDGKYEYVANLSEGDAQYNNGKYTITPDTRAKLSNPKYQGVLLQQIAGQKA